MARLTDQSGQDLPEGTVTFLFTDIEGSTQLLHRLGQQYVTLLADHHRILREIFAKWHGREVDTEGDAFFVSFARATEAVAAVVEAQRALTGHAWPDGVAVRVRMGLHTGEPWTAQAGYVGMDVHRAARITHVGYGGQVLLSETTAPLVLDGLPEGVSLLDLGWHRLKDMERPERIRQLVIEGLLSEFPPLKSLGIVETVSRPLPSTLEEPRHNLPAQLTPFIGREREMAEILELLETARLVTLTGPGGTGKTRLGLQVAELVVSNYADGVSFVALASTTDAELVPNTIGSELGVVEQPDQSLAKSLGRYFGKKHSLLVLDNFEHVLKAASLISDLLAAAPQLSVLATSREALHLRGEHEYPVPPLALPDPTWVGSISDLSAYESVALFIQQAKAISTNFRLTEDNGSAIASICLRLDGLPLAIELAAARIKLFSPQQLLERLESRLKVLTGGPRDVPTRQRTLQDTIDWSYNLLDEGEQRLFARLAVFTGGRTIEAVEAVCSPGLTIDALDGLESLLNKSLLYQEDGPGSEPRFMMLETIHEYARERLTNSGEEQEIRDRHLQYFLSLAEEMEPGYWRHGQLILLEKTEAEMSNLRTAFNWALERGDVETGARLASAIDYFFAYKARFVEGYRWINRILKKTDGIAPEYQVRLLITAGHLAYNIGDIEQNKVFCREALALARELGDRDGAAWALTYLGGNSVDRPEEYQEAVEYCEEGLAIFQDIGDEPGMAFAFNILGELARAVGEYDRAREVYEESLTISRQTGEIVRQNMMLSNLAFVAYEEGDYERARDSFASSLMKSVEIGAKQLAIGELAFLAGALGKLGKPEKAARLLGASDALLAGMGFNHQIGDLHEIAKYIADVQAQLDKATFEAAWVEGQAMTLEQAVAYALSDD